MHGGQNDKKVKDILWNERYFKKLKFGLIFRKTRTEKGTILSERYSCIVKDIQKRILYEMKDIEERIVWEVKDIHRM